MSNTIATVSFRAQGNRTQQTGHVTGRMGKKLRIDYTIKNGEGRQRWFAPSRYDLETLSIPFEDVPRYEAPVCFAQPDEAGAWAAGPAPRTWFCWECGGEHLTDNDWVSTKGDLGASYARSLEIEDAKITAENDERAGWGGRLRSGRVIKFEMKPLASTLYPTLADFVQACADSRWMTLTTDQVPEWPGQEAAFRVAEDGQYVVLRMTHARCLRPEPRLA